MPIHRDMGSAEVHEPKHFSTSTTADAGKVLTPDFSTNGVSVLRNLTPEEVGVELTYGEAALDANTTSFAVTAATDTSLYTTSDYVQLDSTRVPGVYLDHSNNITFNATSNGLIIPTNGDYRISFWMNVLTDTNNSKIGIKAKENGTWCNFTVKHDIAALGRVQNVMGGLITDLAAGNEITIWVASDKTAALTIQDMRFCAELIRKV